LRFETKGPASLAGDNRAEAINRIYSTAYSNRSAKRQRLIAHLHEAGPRPVFEAMLAMEAGESLDDVLQDFARIPVETYQAVGASELPIQRPFEVIEGGTK
jgi:hypothetical protein